MEYLFENFDFINLVFYKEKKNYRILETKENNQVKLIFNTPILNIPFGKETYMNKDLLNLEFPMDGNNELFNFLSMMRSIDNFFYKLSVDNKLRGTMINKNSLNASLINNIKNKVYMSSIKYKNKFDPLIRTHINKDCKFYCENGLINLSDLKDKKGTFTLELSHVWINEYSYGLVWLVNSGNL